VRIGYRPVMTFRAVLRGYLLEEALAWLLRNAGYRLLVHADQDRDELTMRGSVLRVRGRGATHQVDVLGEFVFTPAFSLPIRLFLEAKFYSTPCELPVVRNALGVIDDVNENYVRSRGTRPRRRYRYVYALFSASGFTRNAQDYALAQQISLVDISGASFAWLRDSISAAAADLYHLRNQHHVQTFPVSWMRRVLRASLGTGPPTESADELVTSAPRFRAAAEPIVRGFAADLAARQETELLLGFPAAPLILPLGTEMPARFIAYSNQRPTHSIRLRRTGSGPGAEWTVSPRDHPDAYQLTFNLPERIEAWISENEAWRSDRTRAIKADFLSEITIYRLSGADIQTYQLRYEPSELRRPHP
jgi:hypothetical protein